MAADLACRTRAARSSRSGAVDGHLLVIDADLRCLGAQRYCFPPTPSRRRGGHAGPGPREASASSAASSKTARSRLRSVIARTPLTIRRSGRGSARRSACRRRQAARPARGRSQAFRDRRARRGAEQRGERIAHAASVRIESIFAFACGIHVPWPSVAPLVSHASLVTTETSYYTKH
jgi:hypothetical protein